MKRFLATLVCALSLLCAAAQAEMKPYLLRLADEAAAWREKQLPAMQASAQQAAADVIGGGQLYAFGPQPGFAEEAYGRAGGLMLLGECSLDTALTEHDTVLTAICDGEDDTPLKALLGKANEAGAAVILFGHSDLEGLKMFRVKSEPLAPGQVSTESMSHVLGMWAWTGQFIAACVERGEMPCVYQSYLMPGGHERAAYLQQHSGGQFHETTAVDPEEAARIAPVFLDAMQRKLNQMWFDDQMMFDRSADLLRSARDSGRPVAVSWQGHLFPAELQQPARPDWFKFVSDKEPIDGRFSAVLVLAYQATPWEKLASAQGLKIPVIWTCSQPPATELTALNDHIYLDPHWPMTDAVVELKSYDVPVLPASGIMDSAVYWQLVEMTVAP